MRDLLTHAGVRANADSFSRTFAYALWYAAGILILVCLGMFALPRRLGGSP